MHQSIDHRCRDDIVGERLTPPPERQIRGDHDRTQLVPGCDKLEEQIRRVLIERNVSDFVDDDEFLAANLLQFRFEPAGMVCGTEAGNPVRCRVEEDGVAGVGRFDAESDCDVCFADADRLSMGWLRIAIFAQVRLSLRSMQRCVGCCRDGRFHVGGRGFHRALVRARHATPEFVLCGAFSVRQFVESA